METILVISITALFAIFVTKIFLQARIRPKKSKEKILPPSPGFSLPVVGHLHLLRPPLLHRTLRSISAAVGPVFSLRLGSRLTVVVSSAAAAEECFLNAENDVVLANRPRFVLGKYLAYDYPAMVTAPYGDHWRNLRRVCAGEILSANRLNGSMEIRQDEVKRLLRELYGLPGQRQAKVELRPLLMGLTLNVITRMVAGKRYYGEEDAGDVQKAAEFRELVGEAYEFAGATNPADFLPALRWFDYQSLVRRSKRVGERMDMFLQGLLDEHIAKRGTLEEFKDTMIAHLLDLRDKDPQYYTDITIKGLILMMLTGGTDSSALTVEWAMCNLLNHPNVFEAIKGKIDSYTRSGRLIKESDLSDMNYLNNVVLETLRLYPPAPLLVPHFSSDDCAVGGYEIPRGTMVLVNAWAVHRDSCVGDDPESFRPERFEGKEARDCKMMPFGLGRRACPGSVLANRVVGLVLGAMVQCFEWESCCGVPVDMTEGKGLTMPKADPLVVTCRPRDMARELLNVE
ncbi:PREDICTED: cytochrome P450 81D1 [Tarenaya hassleriana]|uniref:cytochrome P450 81D1 n=1 Tax=Tarenaya hassleriana TaxID=28532 RepID=UPI00053C50B5|nr:PREDICTED: cytochrome P450 81D1 [Tarenaya hassleriana]